MRVAMAYVWAGKGEHVIPLASKDQCRCSCMFIPCAMRVTNITAGMDIEVLVTGWGFRNEVGSRRW